MMESYTEALNRIPPPGTGCHTALLSVANYGAKAGIDGEQLYAEIRRAIPTGTRRIPDKEITEAVNKALSDHKRGTFTPQPRLAPAVKNGGAALRRIISEGSITSEADFWETSPVRLLDEPKNDPTLLLENLYEPTDLIWIGERFDKGIVGETIRTPSDWITFYNNGGTLAPHIVLNPLKGLEGTTKAGKPSFRSDNTIKLYRYCIVEFDELSREDQLKFWSAVKLPVVALIDSGNKSIHGWIDVQKLGKVETAEQWQSIVKNRLYDTILTPLGVDASCSNASRLSRLPGHFREKKGAYQRLLWLSSEGRPISC
ncbi:MAG: hypothetical protein JRC90_05780 [Deltaproteobacteria bacterium]|nr:hypothetical protein [Deltaproteobacteria bacterium]